MFHMPLFIFTTGYLCNFNMKEIWTKYFPVYLFGQIIYTLTEYINNGTIKSIWEMSINPNWLMWYLFSCMIWIVLFPFLNRSTEKKTIGSFVIIALAAGFFPWIGQKFSLSRSIVFFPFFAKGYFARKKRTNEQNKTQKYIAFILFVICAFIIMMEDDYIYLFERSPYNDGIRSLFNRIVHLTGAFATIRLALVCVPKQNIPLITFFGKNTLSVYIIHGIVIEIMSMFKIPLLISSILKKSISYYPWRIGIIVTTIFFLSILVIIGIKSLEKQIYCFLKS